MPRALVRLTACALTLLAATSASAAEHDEGPSDADGPGGRGVPGGPGGPGDSNSSYSWGLGLGGLTQQQAYTGVDRNNFAIPVIYFENRWVQLLGPNLDFKLPELEWNEEQKLSTGVAVQLFGGFGGYEPNDAPILNGMAERKNSILVGPFAKWSNPFADVTLKWGYDVSGESKGQQASLGLEHTWFVGQRFMFTPSATLTWLDRKYADYYYGVRSTEARADRPAYFADSTLNADFELRTDYLIDPKQMLFVSLGYTALGSEIKDSPLTDRSGETMVFLGYLYRFR